MSRIVIPDPGETAAFFRVNVRTLSRWAREGKIPSIRTLGGHRRFKLADVQRLLQESAE